MRLTLILAILCTLALSVPGSVSAATRYASPTGSGSSCTNSNTPCALSTALSQWGGGGDVLSLRGGSYTQDINTTPDHSGAAGNPSVLESAPGETAILYGNLNFNSENATPNIHHITVRRLVVDGSQDNTNDSGVFLWKTGVSDITFEDVTVRHWKGQGFHGYFAQRVIIRRALVYDNGRDCPQADCRAIHGLYGTMPGLLIDGGEWFENGGYGIHIYNEYGANADNTIIRNTRIYGNRGDGGVVLGFGDNIQFYNNRVYNNAGGGLYGFSYGATNGKVYHNTFAGNGVAPALEVGGCCGSARGIDVANNIFTANQSDLSDRGTDTTYTKNLCSRAGTGCALVGDPRFLSAGGSDFHLQANSPAIDQGVRLSLVPTDADGAARPAGVAPDLGAFEYGSAAGVAPVVRLPAPRNFRIVTR